MHTLMCKHVRNTVWQQKKEPASAIKQASRQIPTQTPTSPAQGPHGCPWAQLRNTALQPCRKQRPSSRRLQLAVRNDRHAATA
jgi:hypothetical protein